MSTRAAGSGTLELAFDPFVYKWHLLYLKLRESLASLDKDEQSPYLLKLEFCEYFTHYRVSHCQIYSFKQEKSGKSYFFKIGQRNTVWGLLSSSSKIGRIRVGYFLPPAVSLSFKEFKEALR